MCFKSAESSDSARSGVRNGPARAPDHGRGGPNFARMSSTASSAPPPYEEVTRRDSRFPSIESMARTVDGTRRKSGEGRGARNQ